MRNINNLYRLYDINSKRAIWARDVKILENQFYNFNSSKEADLQVNQESVFDLNQIKRNQSVEQNRTTQNLYSELDDDDIDELALLGTNQDEPRSYKEAIKSPD